MGWQRGKDIFIVERAQRFDDLKAGKADAFVADQRYMAQAKAKEAAVNEARGLAFVARSVVAL